MATARRNTEIYEEVRDSHGLFWIRVCNRLVSVYNNIAGKITEYWLVNEEGIFFLILLVKEGKIIRSWLVLRLPSNSLCYREVVFL